MVEEVEEPIIKDATTLKDILSEMFRELIALLIVIATTYLAIHNNNTQLLADGFSVIIGYWVGTRSSK